MSQVFLTYSLKDERAAAQIREALCRLGLDVWWDAHLPPHAKWAYEVGRALEESQSMIVVVTPRAMESDLVSRELDYAITHVNYRFRVFPVILEPTPDLPGYFRFLQVFDLTKNKERGLRNVAQAIQAADAAAGPKKDRPAAKKARRRAGAA